MFTLSKKHWEAIYKAIILILLFYFISKHKFLIIILAFEILDFLKVYMRESLNYFPLEFRFIFGIAIVAGTPRIKEKSAFTTAFGHVNLMGVALSEILCFGQGDKPQKKSGPLAQLAEQLTLNQ